MRRDNLPALPDSFSWADAPFGLLLRSNALAGFRHLFTTRALTLRGDHADDEWTAIERVMQVGPRRLFAPKQVHKAEVLIVSGSDAAPRGLNDVDRPHADIITTNDRGTAIAVQAADCVPLLFADPRTGAVAAAHAGWRGTVANVARRTVEALASQCGSRPRDLVVAIGPSIGPCCYQVGPDVREAFERVGYDRNTTAQWFAADSEGDRLRLDVPRVNRDQLVAAGVDEMNITVCGLCTACQPRLFFSYRRDGAGTGRLAAAIRPSSLPR